jgi:hypothetical protein
MKHDAPVFSAAHDCALMQRLIVFRCLLMLLMRHIVWRAQVYHPRSGEIGDENQRGSLAIIHNESGGITFRHQFWIKRSDGEFVQWGHTAAKSSAKFCCCCAD